MSMTAIISAAATKAGVPPALLLAICSVESGLRPAAFNGGDSMGGSIGICQVKEATARFVGFRGNREWLYDPETNAYIAALYLRLQLARYGGDFMAATAAYNTGTARAGDPGAKFLDPTRFRNTKYVRRVLAALTEESWKNPERSKSRRPRLPKSQSAYRKSIGSRTSRSSSFAMRRAQ